MLFGDFAETTPANVLKDSTTKLTLFHNKADGILGTNYSENLSQRVKCDVGFFVLSRQPLL